MSETENFCVECEAGFDWEILQQIQPGFSSSEFIFTKNPSFASINENDQAPAVPDYYNRQQQQQQQQGSPTSENEMLTVRSSKIDYLLNSIRTMNVKHQRALASLSSSTAKFRSQAGYNDKSILVPKVIVFSQFSSFLDRIVIEFRALGIDFADIAAGSEVRMYT